ncbi:MAG: hypothetical protein LAT68_06950 [Cyclobacteriaceae bacterium]|nr:hypothetical protein [Cyclobacteriaceae bacterium]MCH8516051.1 hypothetical protein [Cyclobacteriaceae bacterium]
MILPALIEKLLADQEIPFYNIAPVKHIVKLSDFLDDDLLEVISSLGGIQDQIRSHSVHFSFTQELNGLPFICREDDSFNRYRLISLRHPLYHDWQAFNLAHHRQYCRNFEKECFKAAASANSWESKLSQKLFGISDREGVILDLGSSMWKLRALEELIIDMYLHKTFKNFIIVSPFDKLLVDQQLISLRQLITGFQPRKAEILKSYLLRRSGI